jgi:hypothetical protein
MGYVGQAPGKVLLSSGDITDGIIINADVASDAAIALSKTALSAGTGITLSTNTLNVDASQTQITSVGALNAGSITSGFTSIDVGAGAITTTGALSIASMGTNWTNAGRTVADMGSVTTIDINGGTINGITDLAVADGGTGASTATAGFDALAPMTAEGDIIYGGTSGTGTRLAKGSNTQVLTLASGVPSWASPAAGYSDAEAIAAVEGEATLVLAGDVSVANGKSLVIGHTAQIAAAGITPEVQILGTGAADASLLIASFHASDVPRLILARDESGGAIGSFSGGLLDAGDEVGRISWIPSDGVDFNQVAAEIVVEMSTVGGGGSADNDVPGQLLIKTTPDGQATSVTAMRFTHEQHTHIPTTKKLFFDDDGDGTTVGDTYIQESAGNVLSFFARNQEILNLTCPDATGIKAAHFSGNVFMDDGTGICIGHTGQESVSNGDGGTGLTPEFQILGTGQADSSMLLGAWGTTATYAGAATLNFAKSGNASIGSHTIVTDDEILGRINAFGDGGSDLRPNAASIEFAVDGAPGLNAMPGRIVLYTTAAGAEVATEALRLDSSQNATFAGDVEIADSKFIEFASAAGTPTTDNKVQGIVIEFLAAEAITQFDAVYVSTTTGRVGRADANVASMAKMPVIGIAIEAQGTAGSSVRVLTHGVYRDDGGFGGNMTVGVPLYAPEAPGTLTTTAPSDDGDFVQKVGVSIGVRSVFINPSLDVIEHA